MNTKILDKLTKIKAHMESASKIGNEAEAQAFAAAMQRIMMEHEISMTDIETADRDESEPVGEHFINYAKHGEKVLGARVHWRESLASIIAQAHFCRILVHLGSSRITLVGRQSDCEIAEYMIITLTRLLEKMSKNEWRKEWRKLDGHTSDFANRDARIQLSGFDTAYREAFIIRLRQRYETERVQVQQDHSSSTALVRIDKRATEAQAFIDDKFGKKSKAKGLSRGRTSNALGWQRGTEAANRLDLGGKAVKQGDKKKELS